MDDDYDFTQHRVDAEGVHVSEDGKYTCTDCQTVIETQRETVVDESGRRRGVWKCPDCNETYHI